MPTSFGRPLSPDAEPAAPGSRDSSQAGFLLIEVMISSVLVALIAVATFTGFQAATKYGRDRPRPRARHPDRRRRAGNAADPHHDRTRAVRQRREEPQKRCAGHRKQELHRTHDHQHRHLRLRLEQTVHVRNLRRGRQLHPDDDRSHLDRRENPRQHPVRQTSIVTVPTTASIEVKVKDEDNKPVEGATVELREEGKSTGTSQITPARAALSSPR